MNFTHSFGEGTRELLVNTALVFDTTKSYYTGTEPTTPANCVQIWDNGASGGPLGRISGTWSSIKPANEKYRIKIRVCKVGEVINLGFHPLQGEVTYFRLYRENGSCIRFNGTGGGITNLTTTETTSAIQAGSGSLGPNDYTYRMPYANGMAGFIRYYSQAAVGPLPACSTVAAGGLGVGYPARTYCGYTPIQYVVQAADIGPSGYADFFVVFNGNSAVNEDRSKRQMAMLDVTVWDALVVNPTQPTVRKGRLYCAAWEIQCGGLNNPQHAFNSRLYFYSKDSVITSVTFNQMRPFGFVISANQYGCSNTGNTDFDRRSRINFNSAPDYPIFLNNPYSATAAQATCGIVPKSSFGNLISASVTGCDDDRCINIRVDKGGQVGISLLPSPGSNFVPRIFNTQTVSANVNNCIPWDGKDGAGNPILGTTTLQINYFNGLTNLPLYDVEEHQYGYSIALIAPSPAAIAPPGGTVKNILVYWDDRGPASTGVTDFTSGFALDGYWDHDNDPLTPPKRVGYTSGEETGPLLPDTVNQKHSTFNLTGCDPTINHDNTAPITPGIGCHLWTDRGYNGNCPYVSGTNNCAETHNTWWNANVIEVPITYNPSNVHVYSDQDAAPAPVGTGNSSARTKNVCSTVNPIPINGIVRVDPSITSVADANDISDDIPGPGRWSLVTGSASGTFGSAVTNLVNTYIPVAADYTRGYVLLRVRSDSTSQTPCGTADDTLRINLFQGPDVWVRSDTTVCANNATVKLNPSLTNPSGVNSVVSSYRWTPYVGTTPLVGGIFVPNNQSLSSVTTYTPPASFTSGTITMRLRSLTTTLPPSVSCPADSAEFHIIVNTIPIVNALDTLKVCNVGASTTVPVPAGQATISPASTYSILWTGNGTFTGNGTLTPTYTPTAAERAAGVAKIVFRVTRTAAPSCGPVSDTLIIGFVNPPTANAGPDFSLCSNNAATINLRGVATNFNSVSWSTIAPSTGTFASPNNNDTIVFTPSGTLPTSALFVLTAQQTAALCPLVRDTVRVTYTPAPTIEAGANQYYCTDNPFVTFDGVAPSGGEWWANRQGTIKPMGTFAPNDKDPHATYTLTPLETSLPAVGLYFLSTNNGNCLAAIDSVIIFPNPNPTITLRDTSMCSNATSISLPGATGAAYIQGGIASGSILWTSLGSAQNFAPNNTERTVFTPSAADKGLGSVQLVLQARGLNSAGTPCAPVKDTMTITFTPAPTINAGSDRNICSNNPTTPISGTVSPASTPVAWSYVSGPNGTIATPSSLSTTFTATGTPSVPSTTVLRLTATSPGCNPVASTVNINYTAPPTATITTAAGSVCANNPLITVKGGTSTGVGTWVSSSGCTGCFANRNRVGHLPALDSTIYTPSATDITNGSVTFTLQTGNNGNCNTVTSSSVTINITPAPTASISPVAAVCENNPAMTLSATSSTGSGTWTSSTGCVSCFTLNGPNNLTGTYNPSVNDITNGTVTFTFTTAANGTCLPVQATTVATINKAPTVNAGPDLTVCTNQNTIALTGASSAHTSSVAWSVKPGSGTGTITNASSLNGAVYNITATDKTNGTVILVLTGNGTAGCGAVTQERVILFTDIPTANAGPDRTICQNDANPATLDGSGSAGGTWTCAGCAATITNPNSLTAAYTPAASDINQTRTFTYSIPASGGCPAVSDAVNIHFNPAPDVTITTPTTHCGNSMSISLTGSVTNATGLIWTSSGTGSFSNPTGTSTTYSISSADTVGTNSTITFTLISTGSAPCSPDSARTTVTLTDPITLFAGADQNMCGTVGNTVNLTPVTLSGGATTVTWSIVGASTGTLTPAPPISASYSIGAGDVGTTVTFLGTTNVPSGSPCIAQTDQIRFTFIAPVTSTVTAPPAGFCQTGSVTLSGAITNANTGTWTCTNCSGTGTFSPDYTYNNLIPQTSVSFTPSPLDTAKASLNFQLTSDNTNLCGVVASSVVTVNLEKKPRVRAMAPIVRCANNNVITLPTDPNTVTHTNAGVWHAGNNKTTGFAPSNGFPAATTYDPDTTEVQNGFVTLTLISTGSSFCPPDSSKLLVTFSQSPVANAGLDRTICKNNPTFNLTGSIAPSTGFAANWSSPNCGTACFSSPNSLVTNYTLSYPADTNGVSTLMLFLTATDPTGLCAPDRDTVVINMTQPPRVRLTSTFPNPICSDSLYVNLTGTSTGGYNWSSNGTGTFQANAFQPNVVYPLTAADRARAQLAAPNNRIKIYLSSDNGYCMPVRDSVDITLSPAPVVTITTGDSIRVCANINTINLNASVDQAGYNIDWTSSGNGTFNPDAPTVPAFNTTYSLTTLDKSAGSIILVAHTVNPVGSTCKSASKQYKVNITPLPVVRAGSPYTVCQTVTSLDLSDASYTNAGSASWSTNGTGTFGPNNTTVGTGSVYYPSYLLPAGSNDVEKTSITLTLTAVGCSTITDTRVINFIPRPTANAGTDQTVCNEASSVSLTGTSTNANGVSWRVAGSSTSFATTPNATYNLTSANKAAGFVNLVFRVNGNGNCSPVTDTVRINIRPQPVINIGPDAYFCSTTSNENLQYNFPVITLVNGITPTWTTTGTQANLSYTSAPLQPTYFITPADIANGSLSILASTRSHASCMLVSDAISINIAKAPTIEIGPDIYICAATGNTVQLNSSYTNNAGTPSWLSDNTGFFDDPNSPTPIYDPSATEDVAGTVTTIYAYVGGASACPPARDSLQIHFQLAPTLAPLRDTVICYTAGVPFNYSISTGIIGDWTSSSGAGVFTPGGGVGQQSVVFNAPTTPGVITITFDPSDNSCFSTQTATGTVTLVEAPTVTVTTPLNACNNNLGTPINVNSNPQHNGAILWGTIQGFGTINSGNTANPTYTLNPDSSDFALDSILLKVTVQGTNPACPAAIDTVAIHMHEAPQIFLANQIVCSDLQNDANAITLNGNVVGSGYTGTTWSSAQLSSIASPNALITTATLSAFPATVTLTANGLNASCAPVTANLTITAQPAPTFTSPGTDFNACTNGASFSLNSANMNPSVPGGFWSTATGGAFTPNNIGAMGISYTPSPTDITNGTIRFVYAITDTGICYKDYNDTVIVNLNTPITINSLSPVGTFCAQSNSISIGATTSVTPLPVGSTTTWSAPNGLGVFTSTTTLSTFYDPNPSDQPNGGDVGNGGAVLMVKLDLPVAYGCPDDSDYVSLLLVPEPAAIVNAGSSQQICVDRTYAHLQGMILNADGGTWRTSKDLTLDPTTQGFTDAYALETDYKLTAADRAKPFVRLYLYSRGGNALCSEVVDSVDINLTPRPVPSATAGAPSVCADVDSINLTGAFTTAGINGIWSSSGDGYFTNIGIYDPTPIYIPGPTDISVGRVVFTYSSNNYQDCQSYSDRDTTIITPRIVANAGPDMTVCGNNSTGITITATSPPTNTGIWSINGTAGTDYDGIFTQINPLQFTYIPGDTIDPIFAAVSFKFVSTGGTPCKPDSSQMVLKIAPAPTVRIATNTQTVCNDVSSINVNVTSITVATQGYWVSSGTGNFANATALSTSYNFSSSDLDSTNITLAFITTDNTSNGSQCNPAGDAMVITLKPKPVVVALPQYNCITPIGVTLDNSSVTYVDPGASGVWTTNSVGTPGQFSLDPYISSPNNAASYFPSATDITRGTVILTLTSVGAGTCAPVSSSVSLNVSTTPIADAGHDLYVCNGDNVNLKATPFTTLVGYDWSDVSTPSTLTIPSGLQTQAGAITVVKSIELTVTDVRGCTNKDTVLVNPVDDPMITQVLEQCYDYYGYVHSTPGGVTSPLGTYQWYYNGALMSGETRDSVRVTQPGIYQVSYSLGACTKPSQGTTKVLDLPRILTPDFIGCKNSTVTATVNEIPNAQLSAYSPSIKPYIYDWTPASTSTTNVAVLTTSTANLLVIDTLTYYVTSSYTTAPGLTCTYRDSVRVISIPVPDPHLVDSIQVCEAQTITLDANTPPSNLPYLSVFAQNIEWFVKGTTTPVLDNDAIFNPTTSNYYEVRVTIGQCVGIDSSRADFRPYPVKILPDEVKQCFEQVGAVTLDAGAPPTGLAGFTGTTYQWTSGLGDPSLNTSNSRTTVITYPMIRDQEDEQIVAYVSISNHFNALTCPVTDTVLVRDVCVPRVFPPTVFHPGDPNPIDAEFTIKKKYVKNFKITVYSRWGEVIFYSEDAEKHWDGTYRGELMPIGVYAYIITYEGTDETTKGPFKKEGRIVLVR